jgi:hypothetical protein
MKRTLQKPILKWQTSDFARTQEFRFHLPYAFLLLCKLWNTTPDDLLADFMQNLSCGSSKREGRDNAKTFLKNYVFEMSYGLQHYTKEDIQQMFRELECIGGLWPENAKMKMIEIHARWRDKYYNWWFKKWYKKYDRKPSHGNQ